MIPTLPRCQLCPRLIHRRPVPPTGPRPCRIAFLAEAPHVDEDAQGEVLCGKTGMEFNDVYLPILGLPRSQVFCTNACLCSQPDYSNPTHDQARSCASVHLGSTLHEVQPEIIVAMGAVACSLFKELNLNMDHGIPFEARWGGWSGVVFPMYHPTAGIHAPAFMAPLMQDFDKLKKFLKACEWQ